MDKEEFERMELKSKAFDIALQRVRIKKEREELRLSYFEEDSSGFNDCLNHLRALNYAMTMLGNAYFEAVKERRVK